MLLRSQAYAGIGDVPEYGVRNKRGDFDPSPAPKLRSHPDFPLRTFVCCASCRRGLTGSWSKGLGDYYAYCHCRRGCRGVNVTKAKLESPLTDELARLQPTPGYMRLLKESVLGMAERSEVTVDL